MSRNYEQDAAVDLTDCLAFFECVAPHEESNSDIHLYPGQEIIIGREDECNYVISNSLVSKKHFRIYSIVYDDVEDRKVPPLIYCEDLESFNGTYVNDVLIGMICLEKKGYLLCDGDMIEIRPFWKFHFHQEDHRLLNRDGVTTQELNYFRSSYDVSERKLGGGRYGEVFLATEFPSSKQVACKVVNLKLAMKELSESQPSVAAGTNWESNMRFAKEQKSRVMREIKILARLSHPNVIDIKKAFCSHNALYIFMELAAGGDLFSYMQSNGGQLDDYNCRVITRQITLALQYIHSEGLAHRDVKAENVLVTGTHFGGRVILTDFGFAVNAKANPKIGRMMSMVGTSGYVAPEVESIKNPNIGYTKAVDMWSLGILTACMFTGGETLIPRHELPELNCEEIAARHLGSDNSHATVGWQHIPPRALRFIRRLIIINPEERMSADEALEDSWYMKPAGEAAALKDAIVRICRFWTKRDSDANILECFPGVILDATLEPDKQKTYARRKFPDSSLSPYFGLDRHLLQRPESTRKRLLEDLTQSGSQFVQSNELANGGFVVRQPHSRNPSPSIVSVVGNDIFGTYLQKSHHLLETVPELDEADKVLATSVSRNERVWTFTLSEQDNLCTSPGPDASINKRARNDSEDRGTHDAAAKKLPKYTTAKDLREAVNKMKVGSAIGGRVKTVKAV